MGIYPSNVIISVDRCETCDGSGLTSKHLIEKEFGVIIHSIVTVDDIICSIENGVIPGYDHLDSLKEYAEKYKGK